MLFLSVCVCFITGKDGGGCQGPNGTISMLHHALHHYGFGEQRCVIHADNCGGKLNLLITIL